MEGNKCTKRCTKQWSSWSDGGDGFTSLIKFCGRVRHFGGHRSLVCRRFLARDNPVVTLDNRESRFEKSGKYPLPRTDGRKIEVVSRETRRFRSHAFSFPSSYFSSCCVSRILCELATSLSLRVNNPVIEYDRGWRVGGRLAKGVYVTLS